MRISDWSSDVCSSDLNGTPAEIKNLSDDNHLDVLQNGVNSKPYRLYRWQVLHQLIVSDAPRGSLWFWSPKHSPALLVVERYDLLIQRIIQARSEESRVGTECVITFRSRGWRYL